MLPICVMLVWTLGTSHLLPPPAPYCMQDSWLMPLSAMVVIALLHAPSIWSPRTSGAGSLFLIERIVYLAALQSAALLGLLNLLPPGLGNLVGLIMLNDLAAKAHAWAVPQHTLVPLALRAGVWLHFAACCWLFRIPAPPEPLTFAYAYDILRNAPFLGDTLIAMAIAEAVRILFEVVEAVALVRPPATAAPARTLTLRRIDAKSE